MLASLYSSFRVSLSRGDVASGGTSHDYLFAALLHPYFEEVRFRALRVLIESSNLQVPITTTRTLLFFDDEYHAHANCNFFGLKVVGEPESHRVKGVCSVQ